MKRFNVAAGKDTVAVLDQNRDWVANLSALDRERLSKEIDDLRYNGSLIFDQGGSFQSKRSLTLNAESIVVSADFRKPSLLDKVLQAIGLR